MQHIPSWRKGPDRIKEEEIESAAYALSLGIGVVSWRWCELLGSAKLCLPWPVKVRWNKHSLFWGGLFRYLNTVLLKSNSFFLQMHPEFNHLLACLASPPTSLCLASTPVLPSKVSFYNSLLRLHPSQFQWPRMLCPSPSISWSHLE